MSRPDGPLIIKKYSNRRLYDTAKSQYITLEELAETVRRGADVRVVDARSGADLTQVTLTQIIVESRGAASLLPVPLLLQLVRLKDDALAEFFGRWMTLALEAYLQTKQGLEAVVPYNPFANYPMAAGNAMARLFGAMPWAGGGMAPAPPPIDVTPQPARRAPRTPPPPSSDREDVAALRREIEDLRKAVREVGSGRAEATPARRRRRGAGS